MAFHLSSRALLTCTTWLFTAWVLVEGSDILLGHAKQEHASVLWGVGCGAFMVLATFSAIRAVRIAVRGAR